MQLCCKKHITLRTKRSKLGVIKVTTMWPFSSVKSTYLNYPLGFLWIRKLKHSWKFWNSLTVGNMFFFAKSNMHVQWMWRKVIIKTYCYLYVLRWRSANGPSWWASRPVFDFLEYRLRFRLKLWFFPWCTAPILLPDAYPIFDLPISEINVWLSIFESKVGNKKWLVDAILYNTYKIHKLLHEELLNRWR